MVRIFLAKNFFVIGLTSLVVACSDSSNSVQQNFVETPYPDNVIAAATHTCQSASECNPSVAYLLIKWQENGEIGVFQCTGFLVSDDTIMTNSHCLPNQQRYNGADLSNVMTLLFAETKGYPAIRVSAKSVLFTTENKADIVSEQDYAIIKLSEKLRRPKLALTQTGVENGAPLKIAAVNPTSRQALRGVQVEKNCKNVKNSRFVFNDTRADSKTLGAKNCGGIKGNSGAPVLNEQHNVVAILHGVVNQITRSTPNFLLRYKNLSLNLLNVDFAVSTNLACIEFSPLRLRASKAGGCTPPFSSRDEYFGDKYSGPKAEDLLKRHIIQDQSQSVTLDLEYAPHIFRHRTPNQTILLGMAIPVCVKSVDSLLGINANTSYVRITKNPKLFFVGTEIDTDDVYGSFVDQDGVAEAVLSFNPNQLKTYGRADALVAMNFGIARDYKRLTLKMCGRP